MPPSTVLTFSRALRASHRALPRLLPSSGPAAFSASSSFARSGFAGSAAPVRAFASTQSTLPALARLDTFVRRHTGADNEAETAAMLATVKAESMEQLMKETVPAAIYDNDALHVGAPMTETDALAYLKAMFAKNEIFQNHLGMGYSGTVTPGVILRNLLESPAWYTPYTPYQAESAQGRLESLLNYQTMCSDLTGLPVASASLLDEATAAAEAMSMCLAIGRNKKKVFFADKGVHPQTLALLRTRAEGFGIEVRVGDHATADFSAGDVCGALVQYPATDGSVVDYSDFSDRVHASGAKVVMASDLLALTLLKPPAEMGADFALGNAQRFGVPMGYGGPHAAFFATREEYKRNMPGRIIGVSRDAQGKPALRMAMQTREQHIRRDKATSNICTAQALLANISAMYALYHGPKGLKDIATRCNTFARLFAAAVAKEGMAVPKDDGIFDTVKVGCGSEEAAAAVVERCAAARINVRAMGGGDVAVAFDETHSQAELEKLVEAFTGKGKPDLEALMATLPENPLASSPLARTSPYLTHEIFNSMHTEHELLRYIFRLQAKDIGLCHSMVPLGSCTMKLNATAEMVPVTWAEVGQPHPFCPVDQVQGYKEMADELTKDLANITGFHTVSLQPNSGAQGEYAGLMTIKKYHESRGDAHRNICLIPTSAHGTNPASAKMCGMKIVPIGCDDLGNIDVEELRAKAALHKDNLSSFMVTYPSTHGVFEDSIRECCEIIHANGGQVYMDGANMNAQVGLCSPGAIGADVCHLNLHKTFCIPHGGGGPGMGPIGVAKQLAPFLPSHPVIPIMGEHESTAMGPVSAAQYGSASILPISFMYIKMMGSEGLRNGTQMAILKANYMAARLEHEFKILFRGPKGRSAHEFIVDLRPFKETSGITESDVAKRLQDYGFHAPTMSWPVTGTLMIEPTESESKAELDRFCDAMLLIREEIRAVETGKMDPKNNPLKNAPHTMDVVTRSEWTRPYPRAQGAFPAPWVRASKFWPTTSRVDDVFGDRNLVCTCPPMSDYAEQDAA